MKTLQPLLLAVLMCVGASSMAQSVRIPKNQWGDAELLPGGRGPGKGFGPGVEPTVSPISMSAAKPGIEVTQAVIDRWALQTDLQSTHFKLLDVAPATISERDLRTLLESPVDLRAQRFVDLADRHILRADRSTWGTESGRALMLALSNESLFIKDIVDFGGLDPKQTEALLAKMQTGDLESSAYFTKVVADARQGAVRFSRGYRQLTEILRKELDGRDMSASITLVVDIRAPGRQPTISPLTHVTMKCGRQGAPVLVLDQKRRDCNDFGVCRIESSAPITKGGEYQQVYDNLATPGRSYLDSCTLGTTMLVDGLEVVRNLPGKYTATVAPR